MLEEEFPVAISVFCEEFDVCDFCAEHLIAALVRGPTVPVAVMPFSFCHLFTAVSVNCPKIPPIFPVYAVLSRRNSCNLETSSPFILRERVRSRSIQETAPETEGIRKSIPSMKRIECLMSATIQYEEVSCWLMHSRRFYRIETHNRPCGRVWVF